ncbi:hypothetical protein [Calothrix sp. UHCC 0171]|uniref:hypothetical protein n=1 Tax=Calothrix sp. UHCC 0171 TaxID=3110245 RepID=UPI002B207313|nr:hypothetical protein [Calothrix sp. UHCC 0171]MEA5570454.1 hypothetical protein [Calothrix sp. UHCC 0171]
MSRRFYLTSAGCYWSLSKQRYLQFLQDGATQNLSNCNFEKLNSLEEYQARIIKKPSQQAKPIDVTDFDVEHYQLELEHFLKTGEQTGFNAANYIDVFFD